MKGNISGHAPKGIRRSTEPALAGPVEQLGEIGPVHHRIGRTERLLDDAAEFQSDQRRLGAIGVDIDAAGLERDIVERAIEAEPRLSPNAMTRKRRIDRGSAP